MFNDYESLKIGQYESITRLITEEDVRRFVDLTGDDNPLHVDRSYAKTTVYKDIVVHGMIGASFISTVIGTKIPGHGALWVSQNMDFIFPVRLGDQLTISCKIINKYDRERMVELETLITNQNGQTILKGKGRVKMLNSKIKNNDEKISYGRKVALVTGASGGIGTEICKKLSENGFDIVLQYFHNIEAANQLLSEIREKKVRAIAVQADISTTEGANALFDTVMKEFGSVHVLVNNASGAISPKALEATEWQDIQSHIDVQIKGAFNLIRLCSKGMKENRWGRIINITSQASYGSPSIKWTGYAIAKSGLAMLSKYMAAELGPLGITVNCVSPGMCETGMIQDIPEKNQLTVARQTPLRRLCKPSDVAAAVNYLASDQADFVSGETLHVDGGMVMQ